MKKLYVTIACLIFISFLPLTVNAQSLAIRMAEAKIERFVTTPEDMLERARERERTRGVWNSVELLNSRELGNGRVEYTLRYSVDQRTRIYTTDLTNNINGPRNISVAVLGPLGGPNEELSAFEAQRLIDQCREWYNSDADYRRIVDLIERDVVSRLQYDWDSYLRGESRGYQQSLTAGLGTSDVYAQLTGEVLSGAGYRVEMWSSTTANHIWNQVILPDGRILYIDSIWYDNCYDNNPTQYSEDNYSPWYITYDRNFFERGVRGTLQVHGAWTDARRVDF